MAGQNIIEIIFNSIGAEKVGKSASNLGNKFKNLAATAAKYTAAIGVITAGAIKLVEIHGQQARAEAQLEAALGKTSNALLKQASALQRSTRFADEAIIQQQAFLASLDFTEKEIQKMIPAALDLAEATGMDLGSAVKNMAKTFSGMQGELGELIPQLKTLSKEEMIAGGAVDLVNELFGGQAEAAAGATIGIDQLKMTMGDLAETAGSKLAPMLNTIGLAFANILQGAPGSEWWEGVQSSMEGASTETAKLSAQVGGVDRLIQSWQDLSDSDLKEAFQALGIEYDDFSSKQENINFLTGMSEILLKKYVEARKEEKVATVKSKEAAEELAIALEHVALRTHNVNNATKELEKAGKVASGTFQADYQEPINDLTTDFQKFEAVAGDTFAGVGTAAQAAADIIGATAGEDKQRQVLAMRIAQLAAVANTAQGVTKALAAAPPPFNFINAAAVGAAGAVQIGGIEAAISQARSAASGMDEVFDKPTALIVGDTRQGERVQVTPDGETEAQVPTITLNFNSPVTSKAFVRNEIIPEIRNAKRLWQ